MKIIRVKAFANEIEFSDFIVNRAENEVVAGVLAHSEGKGRKSPLLFTIYNKLNNKEFTNMFITKENGVNTYRRVTTKEMYALVLARELYRDKKMYIEADMVKDLFKRANMKLTNIQNKVIVDKIK